jgi:sulfatase modifying factor 1
MVKRIQPIRPMALAMTALLVLASCKPKPAATPPAAPPAIEGMVYFEGGTIQIGLENGPESEAPPFTATVKPFYIDIHPVTVAQFRAFVEATDYKTQSEVFGDSAVFDFKTGQWGLLPGACWHHPFGPDHPVAPDDHPVTQVSWNDAVAYCKWAKKRLPTEVEWEYAARGGKNGGPRYAWGDELVVDGQYKANTWQGHFPTVNTLEDGFKTTSPVGYFGKTPQGLTDMGGNVWQWCSEWYQIYPDRDKPVTISAESRKVHRGGSFLCDPNVCHGYRVTARMSSTVETGLCHVGFRCVRDPQ